MQGRGWALSKQQYLMRHVGTIPNTAGRGTEGVANEIEYGRPRFWMSLTTGQKSLGVGLREAEKGPHQPLRKCEGHLCVTSSRTTEDLDGRWAHSRDR